MTETDPKAQPDVVVIGPDGQAVGPTPDRINNGEVVAATTQEGEQLGEMISEPAKVMRIGSMIKQLLDEVRSAPLDEASRNRLREVHERSIRELEDGLSPDLRDELDRLSLPFVDGVTPSDAELRIAQAQLVGWLEGLFHGIQAAVFAQQMAARIQQEEGGRRALPGGPALGMPGQGPGHPGMPGYPGTGDQAGGGQYL
ncbi:MAG: bacterial proteasome activator family protein [Geodermatophilaceae bacterium]